MWLLLFAIWRVLTKATPVAAIGRVALGVQLQKDLRLPELLAPTDKAAQIPLPLPMMR